jgi:uncharacterized protein (TIGR03435 family)
MAVAFLTVCAAFAQASRQEFEVASVKVAAHNNLPGWGVRGGPDTSDPGEFVCTGGSLADLLGFAYKLHPYQIAGPASIETEAYDVVAKVPAGVTRDQFLLMLQDLLVERFVLKSHTEPREMQVYELVVAKGGAKLRVPDKPAPGASLDPAQPFPSPNDLPRDRDGFPVTPPGIPSLRAFPDNGNVRWVARMQPLAGSFLRNVEQLAGRPVVDRTGLTGVYDFNLLFHSQPINIPDITPPEATAGGDASEPAGVPDLFQALERQLGLRLQSARAPIQVLVVDSFKKIPTEN